MNFLAHHVLATRFLSPTPPLPFYAVGTALPDLLPLAAPRARLRAASVGIAPARTSEETALKAGAVSHLATDAAFHKAPSFAGAQAEAGTLLDGAGFAGIRVRRFFVAHVLVELVLDAALLRADPAIADDFYAAFAAADPVAVTRWAEAAVVRPLPALPGVLARFTRSRYLFSYAEDAGVAEGLSRVCGRARQDTFAGENFARLTRVVGETVGALTGARAESLLAETAAGLGGAGQPPTTPK